MNELTFDEVFRYLGITGSRKQQFEQYTNMLDPIQKGTPVAKELTGDQVSKNGLCIWTKLKAFINKYKHDVDFETVSHVFEDPPPQGFRQIGKRADPHQKDNRVQLVGRIQGDLYLIIYGQREGELIRLISARTLTKAQAERELSQGLIRSSASFWDSIMDYYDEHGNVVPHLKHNIVDEYYDICDSFCKDEITEDDVFMVLVFLLELSDEHVGFVLEDWRRKKKNIKYLCSLG